MRYFHQVSAAIYIISLAALPGAVRAEIPAPVAAMIKAAAQTGDEAELKAVVKAAKATNPDIASEIDALASAGIAAAKAKAATDREAKLAAQGFFEGWGGAGEFGFGMSRGNTRETSGVLGLKLQKDGVKWRHKLWALADYLRSNGETTRQKYNAGYGLDYKFNQRFYAYGSGMWERDKFAGYTRRFTESLGLGYSVISQPDMSLNLEAGPSLRQTHFIDETRHNQLAVRGGLAYKWVIRDGLTFSEDASALMGSGSSTLISSTALTSKLFGAFSARLSYNVQHETNPPDGLKKTDYTTRLTGVYDF